MQVKALKKSSLEQALNFSLNLNRKKTKQKKNNSSFSETAISTLALLELFMPLTVKVGL